MTPKASDTSPRKQQTISSFFAKKRKTSPIDLTANISYEDTDLPPTKRSKRGRASLEPTFHEIPLTASSHPKPSRQAAKGEKREPSESFLINQAEHTTTSINAKADRKAKHKEKSSYIQQTTARLTLREKLELRDSSRKTQSQLSSTPLRPSRGSIHTSSIDESEEVTASSSANKLRKFAGESPFPWEEGSGNRKSRKVGPEGIPCTPLEEAVIQFKGKYPDIVLLIEVGYKYCFFGNDAKIAGQVLGFLYGMDRNFLRTSCPEHNLKVNIKKLVAAGYKVGVISQIETAALKKVGDNRNTLFERKLTALYTPSTFVDDLDAPDDFGQATPPLMVIVEDTRRNLDPSDKVLFGIVSIVPSTGDVVYDEFQDTLLRTELETRLAHTRPSELLLPSSMSTPTEKILCHFIAHGHSGRVRTERINHDFDYSDSFDFMAKFYGDRSSQIVSSLAGLPKQVVIALALAVKHLLAFGLSDALLQIKCFHPFATRAHMLLDTSTIRNLEVYRNQTDFTEKGTLFAVLNRTTTMFGKRLLKSWVGRPLIDATILQHRVDAVEEARLGRSPKLIHLRDLLKGLPDLARGLCRIQYGRCTPKELVIFLLAMNRVASTFPVFSDPAEVGCLSPLWIDILFILPSLKIPMKDILAMINLERARENDKTKLWTDIEKYPSLDAAQTSMMFVDGELAEQLKKLRKTLGIPGLRFVNILSDEYLIELPKERAPKMPLNWVRMGSTKTVVRFRTPEVAKLLQEREQHKETLLAEADQAYKAFLQDIASQHYALFRDVVNKLATADCLMSLAIISLNGEYCKPNFVNEVSLSIVGGRHPIIEQMRPEPFIPNTISLGGQAPRSLVISGPNMGGKTSTVKLVALLLLMAQIGSYVPATSMSLSMHDAIFTRMGASDDLAAGRSTFMVEIAETREIIKAATPNSLVVLDELGVGTSTYDGMAIAGAVLEYLCREIKCQTLFITHYPALARELEAHYPGDIGNRYMDFREDTRIDGRREIRFLYLLADGISKGSFGIECARLAGLPESVLREATSKAETMQGFMEHRSRQAHAKNVLRLLRNCNVMEKANHTVHEIRAYMKIMGL